MQEYLIAQLRAREVELKQARVSLEEARIELAAAQSAVVHVESGRQGLENELRRLVAGKSEVDALASLVKASDIACLWASNEDALILNFFCRKQFVRGKLVQYTPRLMVKGN